MRRCGGDYLGKTTWLKQTNAAQIQGLRDSRNAIPFFVSVLLVPPFILQLLVLGKVL